MKKLAHGFTLIELLVVVSIIGILTTLVAANLNSARARARDAARKSDVRNISTALRLYYNDWGEYPPNCGGGGICGCGSGTGTQPVGLCSWGSSWTDGTTVYMSKLPADPQTGTQEYFYSRDAAKTDEYILSACLENKSDTAGVPGTAQNSSCDGGWVFVIQP
ncbi:MAG TPA: type II secretion system protein [Patescibacteria group bacterium]|nr:type II secretion system protein [Patescibacteria group bacterium]